MNNSRGKSTRKPYSSLRKSKPSSEYASLTGSSTFKEGILSKIVHHLQSGYLKGEDSIYTFDELLQIAQIDHLAEGVKEWLIDEALPQMKLINCIVYVDNIVRYSYKPPLKCVDATQLRDLLIKHRQESLGGILQSDIIVSVPNAERVLATLQSELCVFERADKEKVIFYNPPSLLEPEPWFKELAESVPLQGFNDEKIEVDLLQNKIMPLKMMHAEKATEGEPTKQVQLRRKKPQTFRDNEHVEGLLTYD